MRARTGVLAVAAVSAAACAPAAAAQPVGTCLDCSPSSRTVDGGRTPGWHEMYGVAAITPDDALSVGTGGDDLSVRSRHWDGHKWHSVHPPGGKLTEMWSVAAISATDVWGVGAQYNRSFAEHWDGTAWTHVATPPVDPDTEGDYLKSVNGASTDDVWAVGYTELPCCTTFQPLIEHWDGRSWAKVAYELPYGNTQGNLFGVTVVSPTDAWATGLTQDPVSAPLLLHWNGKTWKPVTDIVGVPPSVVWEVDAIAADDVWAVGAGGSAPGPTLLHWDGKVWTRFPAHTGNREWLIDGLWGVDAVAADDVWAVGAYGEQANPRHLRIVHWDGKRWKKIPAPHPGRVANRLWAVSGTRSDDAWAVGSFADNDDDMHSLYLHWNGRSWSRVRPQAGSPGPPASSEGVRRAPGTWSLQHP